MPNILHRLTIGAPSERVAELVASTQSIEQWWTGHPVTGDDNVGGQLSVFFSDPAKAAAVFEVVERNPEQILWRCVVGPGDWIDTHIAFVLKPRSDGATTLLFSQAAGKRVHERLLHELGRLSHESQVRGRGRWLQCVPGRRD
jgi:hypothetical protein